MMCSFILLKSETCTIYIINILGDLRHFQSKFISWLYIQGICKGGHFCGCHFSHVSVHVHYPVHQMLHLCYSLYLKYMMYGTSVCQGCKNMDKYKVAELELFFSWFGLVHKLSCSILEYIQCGNFS